MAFCPREGGIATEQEVLSPFDISHKGQHGLLSQTIMGGGRTHECKEANILLLFGAVFPLGC